MGVKTGEGGGAWGQGWFCELGLWQCLSAGFC